MYINAEVNCTLETVNNTKTGIPHLVEDYLSCSYAFIILCIMFSQGDDVCCLITQYTDKPEAAKTHCGLSCHSVVYSPSLFASRL